MRKTLLFIFVAASIFTRAQDHKANLDEGAGKLLAIVQGAENQELLIHTDKVHYQLGSTIWFRVYLFNAITHMPMRSAKIHVDLLDQRDTVVTSLLLNSASNEMDGAIKTSSKWKDGPYIIRVYTEEMTLAPGMTEPLEQGVYLFSAGDIRTVKTLAPLAKPGIGFYPEGESLINGLDNVVAFRCFSEQGEPLTATGYIKDDQNKIVETFKTTEPGYGKFVFSPSKNKRYQAFLVMPDKTERSFPLILSAPGAWQLSLVRTTANNFVFRVAQGDSLYPLKPTSYVIGLSNGKIAFASIGNGLYELNVPKENFQEGPADFFLMNEKKEVVSKRQVFIDRSPIQFSIIPDKTSFASRQFINLDLDLKDKQGKPLNGIFSISVTDDKFVGKGTSFSRKAIMDITDPVLINPVRGVPVKDSVMWIQGWVTLDNGQPGADLMANLVSTSDNLFISDTTDSKGYFKYRVPEFNDGKPFMVQVTDRKGGKPAVAIRTFTSNYSWPSKTKNWIADSANRIDAYLKQHADSFLTGFSRTAIDKALLNPGKSGKRESDAGSARNKSSRIVTGEQLDKMGLSNTANAVMMLPGVVMMNGRLTLRGGSPSFQGGSLEPLVITDGVPATNTDVIQYLNTIPPNNLESIEAITGPEAAFYGTRGANGVILVKTTNKMRDLAGSKVVSGLQYIYPMGYHQTPEFYSPPYGEPAVRSMAFTDNRSTVFWKGEVMVDKSGRTRVGFYAADQPSTYTIHVKGISSKGDLIDKIISLGSK